MRSGVRTRLAAQWVILSLPAAACACARDGPATGAEEDGPAVWHVADVPHVSIGSVDGDERYEFVAVQSAWKRTDGRILVFDPGKAALLVYDSAGGFRSRAGGRGNGPGEFQRIAAAWPYRGDSIAVSDLMLRRVSVFDGDGAFARSFHNPVRHVPRPGTIPSQSCCAITTSFADGSFVGHPPDDIPVEPGPPRHSTLTLQRVSADGSVVGTIGTFDSRLFRQDPSARSGVRGYETSYAFRYVVVGNDLVGGNGLLDGLLAVRSTRDGPGGLRIATIDTLPLPGEAQPFTAELREEYERGIREDYAARGSRAYEGSLESSLPYEFAPIAPRFVGIRADGDAHVWLQRWDPLYGRLAAPPTEYDVVTSTGRHIASVKLPEGARFLWAGRGEILLLVTDSLGVQYVRLYRVREAS